MSGTSNVVFGENKRKREALDALINDIVKGTNENVSACLRMALQRGWAGSINESLLEAR